MLITKESVTVSKTFCYSKDTSLKNIKTFTWGLWSGFCCKKCGRSFYLIKLYLYVEHLQKQKIITRELMTYNNYLPISLNKWLLFYFYQK